MGTSGRARKGRRWHWRGPGRPSAHPIEPRFGSSPCERQGDPPERRRGDPNTGQCGQRWGWWSSRAKPERKSLQTSFRTSFTGQRKACFPRPRLRPERKEGAERFRPRQSLESSRSSRRSRAGRESPREPSGAAPDARGRRGLACTTFLDRLCPRRDQLSATRTGDQPFRKRTAARTGILVRRQRHPRAGGRENRCFTHGFQSQAGSRAKPGRGRERGLGSKHCQLRGEERASPAGRREPEGSREEGKVHPGVSVSCWWAPPVAFKADNTPGNRSLKT